MDRLSFSFVEVQSLILVGGNITIDGGVLTPFGRRVEIGAITGLGAIALNLNGSLSVPKNIERGDVFFNKAAQVNSTVSGTNSRVNVIANDIYILEQSSLLAGSNFFLEQSTDRAGEVVINATGTVVIGGGSRIVNIVSRAFTGDAGDIDITAKSLLLADGSLISTSTFGRGNAGSIIFKVQEDILLSGTLPSLIFSTVESTGEGRGGRLFISANTLDLSGGSQIATATRGRGDAGNITFHIRDRISLNDITSNNSSTNLIFSGVGQGARGKGGDIFILANSIELNNGSQLGASTFGKGDAGAVRIEARERILLKDSRIFSGAELGSDGISGNISLITGRLDLTRSDINAESATVDGGNINIQASDRLLLPSNSIISATAGTEEAGGNGGNIDINARFIIQ